MNNKKVTLLCIVITTMLSHACVRRSEPSSAGESKITVLSTGNEFLLGPQADNIAKFLVFLPLVSNYGDEEQNGLLRDWEHSSDCREWTFHLRPDVGWHDGVPVTAKDIKFSLELFFHPDVLYIVDFPRPESISIPEEFSLRLTFPKPEWALEGWTVYYPKHLLENLDPKGFYEWDFWTQPIGNGPFRYLRHVPKTMIEFEANPDHYKGRPKIDKVVLKLVGNPLTELLSGNVDLVDGIDPFDISKIKGDGDYRIYPYPLFGWLEVILWNHRHPFFRDPIVRRALTMAVDRRELRNSLNFPDGLPILDVLCSFRQLREGNLPDPLPYDPERAIQLLGEAGWKDGDGDGILEREGQEFRFTALVRTLDVGVKMHSAVYIQEQLRQIGIRMEIQPTVERIYNLSEPWAASIYSFWNNIATPDHDMGILPFFGAGKKESPIGYSNPEVIALLEDMMKNISPEDHDRIFSRLPPILREDIPMTSLTP